MIIRDSDGNAYSPEAMTLWATLEDIRQRADAAQAWLATLEREQERDEGQDDATTE